MAKLIVNPTSASRREIPLARAILSIGRDPGNDLVLPDAMVSRRHAVIEPRGHQFFLRDCNSSNGSLVNGDRVGECSLKDGDLLAIGTTRLLFREDGAPDSAEAGAKVVPHPHAAKLICPACQADHRPGDQFCRQCGAQIVPAVTPKMLCPQCGSVVSLPAKFCNVCGATLPRGPANLETTKPQPHLADEAEPAPPVLSLPIEPPAAAGPAPQAPRAPRVAIGPLMPAVPAGREAGPGIGAVAPPRPVAAEVRPPRPAPVRQPVPRPSAAILEPANAALRLIAALIDGAVVTVGQAILLVPVFYYWWARDIPRDPAQVRFTPILLSSALVGLALLLGALYYVYFWGVQGSTPGKRALGLVVVDRDGRGPIGVGAAILRVLGYALSGPVLLGLGFVFVPFTGRGLHDWLAGTLVVQRERV